MNPIVVPYGMSLDDSVSSEDKKNRYNKIDFDWSDIVINQYKKNS
jgi:hypothetical protein